MPVRSDMGLTLIFPKTNSLKRKSAVKYYLPYFKTCSFSMGHETVRRDLNSLIIIVCTTI